MTRGVYVHIPFCVVRCSYCDFNAYSGMDHLAESYVNALIEEIRAAADRGPISTIFFGGGTPTQISPGELQRILQEISEGFDIASGAEVTIEANPESVNQDVFERLRSAGFNRVSIGVQSLSSRILASLDRVHSADRALRSIEGAFAAGFDNVNADLIFGTPGETTRDWENTLQGVIDSGVTHVSAYALTVEEGTPLATRVERGEPAPDEDDQADKYHLAARLLADAGFERYEISNWARLGLHCRHNVGYWEGFDYFGFGAGAHSHRAGRRAWNVKLPREYIEKAPSAEDGFEQIPVTDRAREAAILEIRMARGIDRRAFAEKWGIDPADRWKVPTDLAEVTASSIKLKDEAFFLASSVARAFLD